MNPSHFYPKLWSISLNHQTLSGIIWKWAQVHTFFCSAEVRETVSSRSEPGFIWFNVINMTCLLLFSLRRMTFKECAPFRALLIRVTLKNGDKWAATGRQWLLWRQKSAWERYLGFIGKLWLRNWKSQIIYHSSMGIRSRISAKPARCETKRRVHPSSDLYLGFIIKELPSYHIWPHRPGSLRSVHSPGVTGATPTMKDTGPFPLKTTKITANPANSQTS